MDREHRPQLNPKSDSAESFPLRSAADSTRRSIAPSWLRFVDRYLEAASGLFLCLVVLDGQVINGIGAMV